MMKILTAFAFILILAAPVTAANVTKVEIRGMVFDSASSTYNTTLQWDAQKFPGFWYAPGGGKSSETLKIINQPASSLTINKRIILQKNLLYNTSCTDQKYAVFSEKNKKVEKGLEYNSTTRSFTQSGTGGYYARLGWFGELYVAIDGKANKLALLIKDQKKDEKQTLKLGATWNLDEGYNITVEALDSQASPRQAWLSLSRDGKTLDNKVVNEGEVYTYIEKSLKGESDVPVFVTYIDSIFSGDGMATFVQLRYTWLISQNVLEIKAGDKFGVFEVKEANENYVLLYNKDKTINLDQNTVQPLYGDLKFKVADSATALRFYPVMEQTIPASKVESKSSSPTAAASASAAQINAVSAEVSTSIVKTAALDGDTSVTSAPASVQAAPSEKPVTSLVPQKWTWAVFAIVGVVATGYLILRRD